MSTRKTFEKVWSDYPGLTVDFRVSQFRREYIDFGRDKSDLFWLLLLLGEVWELVLSLAGLHEDSPDLEMAQIAGICINWLEKREEI